VELAGFTDEVAVRIGKQLGDFTDFVDPTEVASGLLDPLRHLCGYDETQVRDAAVAAINKIAKKQPSVGPPKVYEIFMTLIGEEWWAPKVSACGLVGAAYRGASSDDERKSVVDKYRILCGYGDSNVLPHDSPLVRAAAAGSLGELLSEMSEAGAKAGQKNAEMHLSDKEKHGYNLSEVYSHLLSDDHDYVKQAAVKASPAVFSFWSLDSTAGQALGLGFKKIASDKAWRVRVAVAEVLADVVSKNQAKFDSKSEIGKEVCRELLADSENEVKHAICERAAEVAEGLGPEFSAEEIFPKLKSLVEAAEGADGSSILLREKLSVVLMSMAKPLGKERALELILSSNLLEFLVNDENINLRLVVLPELPKFLEVVRVHPHKEKIFEMLRPLAGSPNWRVRHAVLVLVPDLARILKEDSPEEFQDAVEKAFGFKFCFNNENTEEGERQMQENYGKDILVLPWALDPIAQIRKDFVLVCRKMADTFGTTGGQRFVREKLMKVLEYANSQAQFKDKYHQRVVLLMGLCQIGSYLESSDLEKHLLDVVALGREGKKEDKGYVPSLRLIVARDLPMAVETASKSFIQNTIVPLLTDMILDEDEDVRFFAQQSLGILPP